MIPTVELQKSLYQALSTNYSVFDVAPKDPTFPFITFGDIERTEGFTKTDTQRYLFSLNVHGWSKGYSSLKAKEIEQYIIDKVKGIELQGFEIELTSLEFSSTLREDSPTGETIFHSIQEFAFILNTK